MKRLLPLSLPVVCLGLALALAPRPSLAQDDGPREGRRERREHQEGGRERGEHGEEGPLHNGMESLNRSLRTLRKSLRDEARDAESLDALVKAQNAVSACKVETPPLTEKQPEEARAAYVVEFRKLLIRVQHGLLDVEDALLDGNRDRAVELLQATKDLEEPGHDRFTEDED